MSNRTEVHTFIIFIVNFLDVKLPTEHEDNTQRQRPVLSTVSDSIVLCIHEFTRGRIKYHL